MARCGTVRGGEIRRKHLSTTTGDLPDSSTGNQQTAGLVCDIDKDGVNDFVIAEGIANHESKIADLDGDADYDILAKSYAWQTPRLDLRLNEGIE